MKMTAQFARSGSGRNGSFMICLFGVSGLGVCRATPRPGGLKELVILFLGASYNHSAMSLYPQSDTLLYSSLILPVLVALVDPKP